MRTPKLLQTAPILSDPWRGLKRRFRSDALFSSRPLLGVIGGLMSIAASVQANAADPTPTPQYPFGRMVTVVCGRLPQSEGQVILPKAIYYTAITLKAGVKQTEYNKVLSIAYPEEKVGPIIPLKKKSIVAGGAAELDCPELMKEVLSNVSKADAQRVKEGFKGVLTIAPENESLYVSVLYAASGPGGDFSPSYVYTIVAP